MHIPITDSHLHLWDDSHLPHPSLTSWPKLNRAYLLSDFMDATKSLHLESCVFIQSSWEEEHSLAEVNWVSGLARRDTRIHGIIAYAPLEKGCAIRSYLETLKNNKLVKGVRRSLVNENNDFCLQEQFLEGVNLLSEFGFSFEIYINASQLPAAIGLVEQCPQVKFILEHLGNPNIGTKQLDVWQKNMSALAVFPNIWCKISRLITQDTLNWSSEDLKPYIYHAIKEFGYERVMFGSDWPHVNIASSYAHWVHILHDLLIHHGASEQELKNIFQDNARRYYALQTELIT